MRDQTEAAITNPEPVPWSAEDIEPVLADISYLRSLDPTLVDNLAATIDGLVCEVLALRMLVVQAHRDSWSDEGEQMWACRGLVALADDQTQVLLRALAATSGSAWACRTGRHPAEVRDHWYAECEPEETGS